MTEEIVIDGVKVSECRFFTKDSFHPLTNSDCSAHCTPYPECTCYDTCDEHPDCYYKQLKRAEIEIEKLKGVDGSIHPDSAYYKITRLEQENKELKEKVIELFEEKGHLIIENNTLKESNQSLSILGTDLASANETVRKEFFRADKNKDMWREKAENYRSALEEINLILDELKQQYDYMANYSEIEEIQNKINEVLNEI